MVVVKKNTLGNFLSKLEKVEKFNFDKQNIIDKVQEFGEKVAREEYEGTKVVISSITDESSVTIKAEGKGIAYMEFGTGRIGDGTYEGQLPTEPLTFESPKGNIPKDIHTTQGWEYDYDNPKTKIMGGWFYGGTFTMGQPAQAQMFNTAERLKKELAVEVGEKIIGE